MTEGRGRGGLDTQDRWEQRGERAGDKGHRQLGMKIHGSGSKGQCFGIQLMPMSHLCLSKPLLGIQRARLQDGVSCRKRLDNALVSVFTDNSAGSNEGGPASEKVSQFLLAQVRPPIIS